MRMARWMCGKRLLHKVPLAKLRERFGINDIRTVLRRSRLRWFGHVQRKDENDWVNKIHKVFEA